MCVARITIIYSILVVCYLSCGASPHQLTFFRLLIILWSELGISYSYIVFVDDSTIISDQDQVYIIWHDSISIYIYCASYCDHLWLACSCSMITYLPIRALCSWVRSCIERYWLPVSYWIDTMDLIYTIRGSVILGCIEYPNQTTRLAIMWYVCTFVHAYWAWSLLVLKSFILISCV